MSKICRLWRLLLEKLVAKNRPKTELQAVLDVECPDLVTVCPTLATSPVNVSLDSIIQSLSRNQNLMFWTRNCVYRCLSFLRGRPIIQTWPIIRGELPNNEEHFAFYVPEKGLLIDPSRDYHVVDLILQQLHEQRRTSLTISHDKLELVTSGKSCVFRLPPQIVNERDLQQEEKNRLNSLQEWNFLLVISDRTLSLKVTKGVPLPNQKSKFCNNLEPTIVTLICERLETNKQNLDTLLKDCCALFTLIFFYEALPIMVKLKDGRNRHCRYPLNNFLFVNHGDRLKVRNDSLRHVRPEMEAIVLFVLRHIVVENIFKRP